MKLDAEPALFAIKCFAAAMLAYYIALRIGLTRPTWAVVTSYIVAQPFAGAVRSKAVYRMIGTLLGATAAVLLVPNLVNTPLVLSLAIAGWLGLCIYVAQLDRTPRSYIFLLAGYTAAIIGLPSVQVPSTIFVTASVRAQEIGLGILCAGLIHGIVFPRTVTAEIQARISTILRDAERLAHDALAGTPSAAMAADRHRVMLALGQLHQLATHLPFDTARLVPRAAVVRALQDRIALAMPIIDAVEDRLDLLAREPGGLAPDLTELTHTVRCWLDGPIADGIAVRDEEARRLIRHAHTLEPRLEGAAPAWADLLRLNLLARLADLVAGLRDARDLGDQIRVAGFRPVTPQVGTLLAGVGRRALHVDHRLGIETGLATAAAMLLLSVFWIATAWSDGGGAVLMAGMTCALFGALPSPSQAIRTMLAGSTCGLVLAIIWAFTLLPGATDFVTVAAVLAPPLLLLGALLARPATTGFAIGMVLGFPQTVGLNARYAGDFAAAVNGAVAQTVGITVALLVIGAVRALGNRRDVERLLRAAWADVAARARGAAPDDARWTGRMLDRAGLLAGRLLATDARADTGAALREALVDLRVGMVAGELSGLQQQAPNAARAVLARLLAGIAHHFTARRSDGIDDDRLTLLPLIDEGIAAVAPLPDAARRGMLVALTSLRRNLLPQVVSGGSVG